MEQLNSCPCGGAAEYYEGLHDNGAPGISCDVCGTMTSAWSGDTKERICARWNQLTQAPSPTNELAARILAIPCDRTDSREDFSANDYECQGYGWGWREALKAAAALCQPGAVPAGVIALRNALARHDSAARELFGRDDQAAWAGLTVGQLREVLVAALGLPAGTIYGG